MEKSVCASYLKEPHTLSTGRVDSVMVLLRIL